MLSRRHRQDTGAPGDLARTEIDPLELYELILDVAMRVRDTRASRENALPVASNAMLDEIARNAAQALYGELAAMELAND